MGYVLVPGDVYPYTPVDKTSTASPGTAANVNTWSSVHLLATCKQAYLEGHTIFYSSNTFHLPPTLTFSWSDRLLAKHKAMIKRISLTIGLVQLTSPVFKLIESGMPAGVSNKNGHRWAAEVGNILVAYWCIKLEEIADWDSLEELELHSISGSYLFQHHEVVAVWKRDTPRLESSLWNDRMKKSRWNEIIRRSYDSAYANIVTKVTFEGWEMTKEWLDVR